LLVVLIFLMVTTTFSKFTELQVNLPSAGAARPDQRPREIVVAISGDGRYQVDERAVSFGTPDGFAAELQRVAAGSEEPTLVIYADAGATHQSVVNVLEAARLAGLARVTFAAQAPGGAAKAAK
ncbi:MAG TPA: biopolymer transporter ExbD, partial [Quisquiliibacterium sp.]|nr:biopolymer transporter ExbD [Quisquiliibacterium sp.]